MGSRRGARKLGKRADRFVLCLLSALLSQVAGSGGVAAEEFHTPSISAMRVEWRAALDQFRTEVNVQSAAASTFSFAIQQRFAASRSEEHTSDLQSLRHRVYRLLL